MTVTSVGMMLMLLLDIIIAARFGTSIYADAIFISLSIPILIDTVARESTKFSLIPIVLEYRAQNGLDKVNALLSSYINAMLVLCLTTTFFLYIFSEGVITLIGPGLNDASIEVASQIFYWFLPMILSVPLISILTVFLNSIKKFNTVGIRNIIIPISVIVFIWFNWDSEETSSYLAAGYSVGYMFYAITLFVTAYRNGFSFKLILPKKNDYELIYEAVSWPTLGFVIRQMGRIAERSIASLVGVGAVSSYYYGYRIFSAIQTVIGTSVATVKLPSLSMTKEYHSFKSELLKSIKIAALFTVPIAILLGLFNETVIQLIFSRGNFESNSIQNTAIVMSWLSFGIPFMCLIPILNSGLYSLKKFRFIFLNMLFLTVLNVSLGYILSKWYGLAGLSSSVSITAFVSFIILYYTIYVKEHGRK